MKKRIYIILCVCSLISFFILHFSLSGDLPLIRLNILSAGYYSYKLVLSDDIKMRPKECTGGSDTAYLVYQSKKNQDIYIGYIAHSLGYGSFVPKGCESVPAMQITMDMLIDGFLKYIMLILSFIFLLRVIFGTWGKIKLFKRAKS